LTQFLDNYTNNVLPLAITNALNNILPGVLNNILPGALNNALPGVLNNILPGALNNILPGALNNILPGALNNALPGVMIPYENNSNKTFNYLTKVSVVPCIPLKSTGPPNLNWQPNFLRIGAIAPTAAPLGSLPSDYNYYFPQNVIDFDKLTNIQCNNLISFYGLVDPITNVSFGNGDTQVDEKRSALKLFICEY
jgi:hypothetical protein